MEENEYRSTYRQINETRCVYEKALNARRIQCRCMRRFLLAGREGVGCQSLKELGRCESFLDQVRAKARFVLQLTTIDGPLPHNKEIRVQVGGLQGLQRLLRPDDTALPDASKTLDLAAARYGSIEAVPYQEIMPAIAQAKGRQRRR